MGINSPSNFPDRKPLSKRAAVRRAFYAALSTIPLAGAAHADPKPQIGDAWKATIHVGGKETTKPKKNSEAKHVPKHPSVAEAKFKEQFLKLSEAMNGVRLVRQGDAITLWQYEEFCKELDEYCKQLAGRNANIVRDSTFTPELLHKLQAINTSVNWKLAPKTDMELYGIIEKWTIPTDAGDCEDYALLKMLRLVNEGFDPRRLHMLVVRDEKREGHAVLAVDVYDKGVWNTLILDNKHDAILTLDQMERNRHYEGTRASFVTQLPDGSRRTKFFEYAVNK